MAVSEERNTVSVRTCTRDTGIMHHASRIMHHWSCLCYHVTGYQLLGEEWGLTRLTRQAARTRVPAREQQGHQIEDCL